MIYLGMLLKSWKSLACRPQALPFVAEGRTWSPDMRAVTKAVFASPTETAVNLDSSRAEASNPATCYPQICFAVDNFEDAFEEMVSNRVLESRLHALAASAILGHIFLPAYAMQCHGTACDEWQQLMVHRRELCTGSSISCVELAFGWHELTE
jgi:hypothetical protein